MNSRSPVATLSRMLSKIKKLQFAVTVYLWVSYDSGKKKYIYIYIFLHSINLFVVLTVFTLFSMKCDVSLYVKRTLILRPNG